MRAVLLALLVGLSACAGREPVGASGEPLRAAELYLRANKKALARPRPTVDVVSDLSAAGFICTPEPPGDVLFRCVASSPANEACFDVIALDVWRAGEGVATARVEERNRFCMGALPN